MNLTILFNLALIAGGFVLLIKGAEYLVSGASSLAKKFNVSELTIGLTVVSLGTSAPELVVNIISGTGGHSEVVFGNIIGSNIFNLFLILGVSGTIYPLVVQRNTAIKEVPFSLLITGLLLLLVNDQVVWGASTNQASTWDGIILFSLFCLFIAYVFYTSKDSPEENQTGIVTYTPLATTIRIVGGLAGLGIGGNLVVDNAIEVAHVFNVSEKLIGLTIVAAGTSLPELATSAMAAFRKQPGIAIGNVVGSNIFNILLVLGTSAIVTPLTYNPALNTDIYILVGGTLLLMLFMVTINKRKLDRRESVIYLITFIVYMVYLFMRK